MDAAPVIAESGIRLRASLHFVIMSAIYQAQGCQNMFKSNI
jgi:hypothetical protein